jgi:hypothetical protein
LGDDIDVNVVRRPFTQSATQPAKRGPTLPEW